MTITGYENYTFAELERMAYQDQNKLAQEVIRRIEDEVQEAFSKGVKTKYKGESN